ncbi:MAG: c-type cytochrome [Alphaproteobacteria bacterium]
MRQLLIVTGFALFTIAFFAGFSNFGIPQIEPAPPPKAEKLDLGSMTMDRFVALGEKIFNGRGNCTLCHNSLGRAPMLDDVAQVVPKRLSDPRYTGAATDVETYLRESMVEPSAYVVAGFGKKGSDDTVSPMPNVSMGAIGLSDVEIKAVIAFLQDSAGAEVTVEIPTDSEAADEEQEEDEGKQRVALTDPRKIMAEFNCEVCHKITGEGGDVGPDLTTVGARRDKTFLRQSILDPNAEITEGFESDMMPADLGEQIYAGELEILVDFLAGMK